MFSKVWRVHRFTTKAKTDPKVSLFYAMFVQFINMKDKNPQPNPLLLSSWNRLFYFNLLIASATSPRLSSDDENLICSLYCSSLSLLLLLPHFLNVAEKSGTLEALHDGVMSAYRWLCDTHNMADSRSTRENAGVISTRRSNLSKWWHQDPARTGALREWE